MLLLKVNTHLIKSDVWDINISYDLDSDNINIETGD